jgi:hypothetical protein
MEIMLLSEFSHPSIFFFHVSIEPMWNGNTRREAYSQVLGHVSIEPLWNGNNPMFTSFLTISLSLNRTIVEWKLPRKATTKT